MRLWNTHPHPVYTSSIPPRHMLALEYIATCAAPAAAIILHTLGHTTLHTNTLLLWVCSTLAFAAQGTSPLGRMLGLWYEDVQWQFALPWWRVVGMVGAEVVYGAATVGVGSVVSLVMRCCSPPRQCMGERLVGGRMVVERRVV